MPLVSTYDPAELETIQRFFSIKLQPKAYMFIMKDTNVHSTSDCSFRDKSRTSGKGSKLYHVPYLKDVRDELDALESSIQSSLPSGCTDLKTISTETDISTTRLSALFSVVGLDPHCTYRRDGARRPVHAYRLCDVKIVLAGVKSIYDRLEALHVLETDVQSEER